MPCQNVFSKSFLFRYYESMSKNSKLSKVQIKSLVLIVFSFMGVGCSSIYEYKPPAIVNTDDNEVAVAHKNKWRFVKITTWLVRQKFYEKQRLRVTPLPKAKLYFIVGTVMIG